MLFFAQALSVLHMGQKPPDPPFLLGRIFYDNEVSKDLVVIF